MSLIEKRKAIRHLLNNNDPADAQAVYYAFYHPEEKTQLFTYTEEKTLALGYVCVARTGIDLFRPLITMRLPTSDNGQAIDLERSKKLIQLAIPSGSGIILSTLADYQPILGALFDVSQEQLLKVFALDRFQFEPVISVLVTKAESYNGLPRYVIRQSSQSSAEDYGEILASAGLNWRSSNFAELYVHTKSSHRRQGLGLGVVSSIVQSVLEMGQTPLYVVNTNNEASLQLAQSLGFRDSGARWILVEGFLRS